ncbi:MAG: SagB/ThcOx family dehydrogenase [Candidatus Cloacimonadota bacterium]|nr:SagB/ThcOx family dehydrogenase [Candidatus Cloacimonadota bacterium]
MHIKIKENRNFMKSNFRDDLDIKTDQEMGKPQPALQKPYGNEEKIILPEPTESVLMRNNLFLAIKERKSRRHFSPEYLSSNELSYLLWSTQGVKKIIRDGYASIRTVPSAGARNPYETYLVINRVDGIKKGVYRYLPLEHSLIFLFENENIKEQLKKVGQSFISTGAVVFIWTCIPYRNEWRYSIMGHKPMLLDAGHICQNLYLACESINCGTCAIAAYNQTKIDNLLRLDGEDEFVVYLAPVGKKDPSE